MRAGVNDRGGPGWRNPHAGHWFARAGIAVVVVALALAISACGPSWSPDRPPAAAAGDYRLTPDGGYRVRRGDTLYAIAFNFGVDWRDLARWNDIAKPYVIYPDQELRMSPPARSVARVETRPAPPPGPTASRERAEAPVSSKPKPSELPKPTAQPAPPPSASSSPAAAPPGRWLWPTDGRVVSTFRANDPARNGIDIGGAEGQPVVAAAAGEVVYSGNGLIGYGELVIIKHDDRLLSAYAHNRRRLVSEGQRVGAGERVAEMGRNDRNQAMLHFEVRVDGAPQDPLKFLAPR